MIGAASRRRKQRNLELYRDITDDVEESDFVPHVCFYNAHTIITKNGELCQTIKITGFKREVVGEGHTAEELRTLIRSSLKRHVPNDSFAIWLHTIRRNTDVSPGGDFPDDGFAKELNDLWIAENNFERQFVNEVFVTIVHEGQSAKLLRPINNLMRGLISKVDLKWRNDYLDNIYDTLNGTVDHILDDLKNYGAERLGMYEDDGIFYSDQLRFLEKLINFVDRPMPVVEMDLSSYLTTGEITFAYNAMEVRTALGKRRFASILTLKEYKEASLPVIDRFLQLPMEFIVTQCVNFVNPQKVLFEYQELYNYQRSSEDRDISRLSELTDIIESNNNNPNDFGEQQLTIFILSDTVDLLEQNMRRSMHFFSHYGMVAVREDIKFEETYWAQVPGNFVFVSRMQATNTSHVAGFANLHNLPVGIDSDSHWGNAVTTFHTASGTPYYFNFHVGNVGHTTVVGPLGSGKAVFSHFLLVQSLKFSPQIYYFDVSNNGVAMAEKLNGRNITVLPDGKKDAVAPLFNPFSLSDNDANRQFLNRWAGVLARTMEYAPTEADKSAINDAINAVYQQPKEQRNFKFFVQHIEHHAPDYVRSIVNWMPNGQYGHIFTATDAGRMSGADFISLSLKEVMTCFPVQATVISLLLQRVTDKLDGRPTIIAMEEGWRLLSQTHFAAAIDEWMDYLTEKNTILFSLAEDISDTDQVPMTKVMADKSVTQIYMPDDEPCMQYQTVFGLDDVEFSYLDMMERSQRHFLIKRAGDTVVGEMDMHNLEDYLNVLSGEHNQQMIDYDLAMDDEDDTATAV